VRGGYNNHANCGFMMGYVDGVLDEGFKEYYRWAREIDFLKVPERILEVSKIEHSGSSAFCRFDLELREEELVETFDAYSKCKRAYYGNELGDVIRFTRTTIEFCLRERVGLPTDFKISSYKIVDILEEKGIENVDFHEIRRLLGKLSGKVHSIDKAYKNYCLSIINALGIVIHSISRIEISKKEWDEIRKKILDSR
jgi:hypothetical protein